MEKEKEVIKLNSNKELTVNISSLEDLLNSIKYATTQMNQAKDGLAGVELQKDFSYIKDKLDDVVSNHKDFRDVVFDNFVKDMKKTVSNLPKEDTLQALIFEINRFNKVDTLLNKIGIKNTLITSVVMSVIAVAAVSYTKVIDKGYQRYLFAELRQQNYVIPKNDWEISKSDAYGVELKRKSQLNSK